MPKILPAMLALMMILIVLTAGCDDDPDERLTELTKQSLHQQAEQNQRLIEQSRNISEAAKTLVESDAEARKQVLEAHTAMQQELERQQTQIDEARTELERERREIAQRRVRDPIIAELIHIIGMMFVCSLPLLLAGFVLYVMTCRSEDAEAITELLVTEITSNRPRLLPRSQHAPALEHQIGRENGRATSDTETE